MSDVLLLAAGVGVILFGALAWIWIPYLTRRPPAQHDDRARLVVRESYDWHGFEPRRSLRSAPETARVVPTVEIHARTTTATPLPSSWREYLDRIGSS